MGKDGIWTSSLDGPRTAQIVEFPGQLDFVHGISGADAVLAQPLF